MEARQSLVLALAVLGASACGSSLPEPTAGGEKSTAKPAAATVVKSKSKSDAKTSPMSFEDELIASAAASPTGEKRAKRGESRSRSRAATSFRIADLPIAVLPKTAPIKVAPSVVEGTSAKEIVTKKNDYGSGYSYGAPTARTLYHVRVSGEGWTTGAIRIGPSSGFFGKVNAYENLGVSVACGKDEANHVAHWEGYVEKGGKQSYVLVDGWFDAKACRAVDVTRTEIPLAEIVPNVLYGYRQCDDATCSARTSLGLVMPSATSLVMPNESRNMNQGASTRVVFPVARGGSQSLLAGLEMGRGTVRELSVEVIQSVTDAEPLATAFLDAAR